jgi:hypothetical protein
MPMIYSSNDPSFPSKNGVRVWLQVPGPPGACVIYQLKKILLKSLSYVLTVLCASHSGYTLYNQIQKLPG